MRPVVVFFLASGLSAATAACGGNYCGMFHCGGALHLSSHDACDYSVAPRDYETDDHGGACVDACCRAHDMCCDDEAARGECNARMIACLETCDSSAASCLYGALPVPAWLMTGAFRVVEGWCCNRPC